MGYQDALEIVGRKDRQFSSGGENIIPEEIEQALLQIPEVIEARVEPEADVAKFGPVPIQAMPVLIEIVGRDIWRVGVPYYLESRFDGNKMYQRRYLSDRFFDLVVSYSELAREAGLSPVQLGYGWLAARPGVDSVLLGPADVAQLDAGIDACAKPLGADLCARVDEIHRAYTGTDATYARLD